MENEFKDEERLTAINRLLTDYSKSQSTIIKDLRNAIIVIALMAFIVIVAIVGGFLWYEGQFDHSTTTIEQDAELEAGDAIINNGGTINAE